MEKFIADADTQNNDLLPALADGDLSARLLKVWIKTSSVTNIKALFETLVTELKGIIDFAAADLLFFETATSTRHTRLSYNNMQFYEFINVNDPLLFAERGKASLTGLFGLNKPRQTNALYWLNKLPTASLFYKKETEFKHSYFIPFFQEDTLAGIFQLRTDNGQGFTGRDITILQIAEKILTPIFHTLLQNTYAVFNRFDVSVSELGVTEADLNNPSLLTLSGYIAGIRNKDDLNRVVQQKISTFFPDDDIVIYRAGDNGGSYRLFINHSSDEQDIVLYNLPENSELVLDQSWIDVAQLYTQPKTIGINDGNKRYPEWLKNSYKQGCKNVSFAILGNPNAPIGLFIVFSRNDLDAGVTYVNKIKAIGLQLSIALNNIITNEKIEEQFNEINKYKQQLEIENHYLQEEIETTCNYGEIVGTGEAMKKVFHLVSQVADTQSSVLILGETGTGKELIARALHNTSSRKKKMMVKVNCAALPASLIESELFGHEKGSFTGATERRIGKFELANNSTLFLDEIGELPPDLQVKLLRALQEREIERIGGNTVIKVNVRIVAATNRNLLREVQAGNFRSDLYFRLNVFPITIVALRDRKEDIPLLATHFLKKQAYKGTRRITGFSSKVMKQLTTYDWPGNVRELEHMIERCVLLTSGTIINQLPFLLNKTSDSDTILPEMHIKTIDEIERAHILYVLKRCNNKVAGIGGAADLLKIPPSTLNSKMRRLKIKRNYPGNAE